MRCGSAAVDGPEARRNPAKMEHFATVGRLACGVGGVGGPGGGRVGGAAGNVGGVGRGWRRLAAVLLATSAAEGRREGSVLDPSREGF